MDFGKTGKNENENCKQARFLKSTFPPLANRSLLFGRPVSGYKKAKGSWGGGGLAMGAGVQGEVDLKGRGPRHTGRRKQNVSQASA